MLPYLLDGGANDECYRQEIKQLLVQKYQCRIEMVGLQRSKDIWT